MVKHLCPPNTTSDQSKYADPVPFIGLYIAGASLVCLLLMILDVFHAYQKKKKWLPCKFFSLNSVTLTLLSVAAKLPVDLTTSMPSSFDQLSKLTGTALICVSMGFFMPSLGNSRASETGTNLAALTILVVTVVVNTCIQISTGVIIDTFIPEHIIIMCLMWSMLITMYASYTGFIILTENAQLDLNKDIFTKGRGYSTVLERLKSCYFRGYNSDPQFVACKNVDSVAAGVVSISCLIVLLQVTVRSHFRVGIMFCNGVSDYGWSMRIIVVSQLLVILLASLATCSRVFLMRHHIISNSRRYIRLRGEESTSTVIVLNFPVLIGSLSSSLLPFFTCSMFAVGVIGVISLNLFLLFVKARSLFFFIAVIEGVIIIVRFCCIKRKYRSSSLLPFFTHSMFAVIGVVVISLTLLRVFGMRDAWFLFNAVVEGVIIIVLFKRKYTVPEAIKRRRDDWFMDRLALNREILKKCEEDIKDLTRVSDDQRNYMRVLRELLQKSDPSRRSHIISQIEPEEGKGISSLYLVFLVKVASVSLPSSLSGHLSQWLSEVFDVIHFIDTKLNCLMADDRRKCELAKALWMGVEFGSSRAAFRRKFLKVLIEKPCPSPQLNLARALEIIGKLKDLLPTCFMWNEVSVVMDFINNRGQESRTIEELYGHMEELFVSMLYELLSQLPHAMIKEVDRTPFAEYNKKVRLMLKFLGQIQYLEGAVVWSFPDEFDIKTLIPSQTSASDNDPNATEDEEQIVHINDPDVEIAPV